MILGILSRFFGGTWNLDAVEPPWGTWPSIFEHIRTHMVDGEEGLAFMSLVQGYDDRETILTLARHEEFTL